ncbi:aminopeptidase P family protein [Actinosynnema sp. NPDC047251]|uniref:Xaa-Pro aminopeptidase n=1 Tax=Saccharothrix espanaensis (strain ATCC 51144 / DSM 44229 / JCM 9112 / NBRC 15066 / NRRL 15764) TaxID=1179773 RepID=K0JZI6_SACES|nr:aminopeptidase P family protein [Saccharothrix espanaensis]CCH29688.1 Xaa-Pro aminopeptidase 2 [Saccharothrix espanaensis DSM 44229]
MNNRTRRDLAKPAEADGFRTWVRDGWADPDVRADLVPGAAEAAAAHRDRLSAAFPGRRLALAAGRPSVRSHDTFHDFRADTDFVWLTGFRAEGAVLVMQPSAAGHDTVLYLPTPADAHEVDFFADADRSPFWVGAVPGPAEWERALGLPCRPLEELPRGLRGRHPATLSGGRDPLLDALAGGPSADLRRVLAELRRIKDDWEVGQLRAAVAATVDGFADVARELGTAVRGGGERWLQGTFDRRARTAGNGPGYASIVAAGANSPVLHWTRCDGAVREDDLLLLDAGVEATTLYTADVTRTFPVSGEFSEAQRGVYDLVHDAHVAALAQVRPGNDFRAFHDTAMRVLAEGLHDWGLLPVSVDKALDRDGQHHRRYIVCGTGHFLGLDVHDCARSRPEAYQEGVLEQGMALTVEPGLYFHPGDLTLPPELRGIGVRIEDDLVVTATGAEVLSAGLPTTADGIGAWVSGQG